MRGETCAVSTACRSGFRLSFERIPARIQGVGDVDQTLGIFPRYSALILPA